MVGLGTLVAFIDILWLFLKMLISLTVAKNNDAQCSAGELCSFDLLGQEKKKSSAKRRIHQNWTKYFAFLLAFVRFMFCILSTCYRKIKNNSNYVEIKKTLIFILPHSFFGGQWIANVNIAVILLLIVLRPPHIKRNKLTYVRLE